MIHNMSYLVLLNISAGNFVGIFTTTGHCRLIYVYVPFYNSLQNLDIFEEKNPIGIC